ncbi:helix-turn-helix domain-containing protein [Bacillus sp. CGMCC 1.16607]|uniref:helix-turn-helix domain-containing protein n=1 Tax=Bacillus sp. CGMCC 1.16607 TaxID=3351842 RepID=UPI00363B00C6
MFHPGKKIKEYRLKKGYTQEALAEKLGMKRENISHYERGVITNIPQDIIWKIADILETTPDTLLGLSNTVSENKTPYTPEFTAKDERDIQRELQNMLDGLSKSGYAAFDGRSLDEMDEEEREDRELLISSLENSLRLAKRIAKQKFTPKKYRK